MVLTNNTARCYNMNNIVEACVFGAPASVGPLFVLPKIYLSKKEKQKCDYCGEEYDVNQFGTLDNGSEASFKCIKEETVRISEREKEMMENTEEKK